MKTEHCIEVCNGLLRGERSAIETYDKAISSFGAEAPPELKRIRAEHVDAAVMLEENVISMGGTPDLEAGPWGAFVNTVQGAADALGKNTALESLQTGERTGKRDYEKALEDDDVMEDCKNMIRANLLPRVTEHIGVLERIQEAA